MSKKRVAVTPAPALPDPAIDTLYLAIRQLMEQARTQAVVQVNQALVLA